VIRDGTRTAKLTIRCECIRDICRCDEQWRWRLLRRSQNDWRSVAIETSSWQFSG